MTRRKSRQVCGVTINVPDEATNRIACAHSSKCPHISRSSWQPPKVRDPNDNPGIGSADRIFDSVSLPDDVHHSLRRIPYQMSDSGTDSRDHFRKRSVAEAKCLQDRCQDQQCVAGGICISKPCSTITRQGQARIVFMQQTNKIRGRFTTVNDCCFASCQPLPGITDPG